MTTIPQDLNYTTDHEWVKRLSDLVVQVGITDFAQRALGDIVFVSLPKVGEVVQATEPMGEVESTKSVSEVFAPVSGTIIARNETLDDNPESINADPYGEGWLVEITVDSTDAFDTLHNAASYQALIEQSN